MNHIEHYLFICSYEKKRLYAKLGFALFFFFYQEVEVELEIDELVLWLKI